MPSSHLPPRCWAELDSDALLHNADTALAQGGTDIMAVVKANAYGHGAVWAARVLEDRSTLFAVANLHEAEELREAGITRPILLFSPCLSEEWEPALKLGFHVPISTLEEAQALDALAADLGLRASAHLALDTGMGRVGFLEEEWGEPVIEALLKLPHVTWMGLATHLPSPDEDENFTRAQMARFKAIVEGAKRHGLSPKWIHAANSAGLLGYDEPRGWCNLTRPGLMLYGVSPLPEEQDRVRPVLTWKTRITLVRELPAGHGVSYGRTFITERPTLIATLACGYADGYPRQVSGKGAQVLIHGRRCPILGRVTMDQILVDVSTIDEPVVVGEEAVLLGRQGDEEIPATELAGWAGTIAWDVFTGIGARVRRVAV